METFSALLALCAGNSPVPVNSLHKGQWRGALMFPLICARINDWANNREAGDLRRHRGHYDVSVMWNPCLYSLKRRRFYTPPLLTNCQRGSGLCHVFLFAMYIRITNDVLTPSGVYMHQWIGAALIQIIACRLFHAKPLSKPMLGYYQLDPGNKFRWNFYQNTKFFILENVSENVACQNGGHFVYGEVSACLYPWVWRKEQ